MVLAAGKGTRLGEQGRRRAKALSLVGDRPLLQHHLDWFEGEGLRRVVVNAHHLAEQVEEFAAAYDGPLDVRVVVEPELLGTAGGVINALEHLGSEPFFVLYGDVLMRADLRALGDAHAGDATLAVYEAMELRDKGVVEVDGTGRITAFHEKDPTREGPGLVNAGLYVVDPALVQGYTSGVELDFGHDVFPAALERGAHLQSFVLDRAVLDIGTPEALDQANRT